MFYIDLDTDKFKSNTKHLILKTVSHMSCWIVENQQENECPAILGFGNSLYKNIFILSERKELTNWLICLFSYLSTSIAQIFPSETMFVSDVSQFRAFTALRHSHLSFWGHRARDEEMNRVSFETTGQIVLQLRPHREWHCAQGFFNKFAFFVL
jgi:hypothetical protein